MRLLVLEQAICWLLGGHEWWSGYGYSHAGWTEKPWPGEFCMICGRGDAGRPTSPGVWPIAGRAINVRSIEEKRA